MSNLDSHIITTILIYAIGNIGALIWLISTLKTDMNWLKQNHDEIKKTSYSQSDAAKDFLVRDREVKSLWNRLDEVRKKVYGE